MGSAYDPILTKVGLLSGGKLTKEARDRYIAEVIGLLVTGNESGKGGTPTTQIFSSLVPLPPIPGPTLVNVTTLSAEPAFWFSPDPLAAVMTPIITNREKCPLWHSIFIDILYEKTAVALDVAGTTPLFPIFDVTAAFPNVNLPLPYTPPDLAAKLEIPPPKLLAELGSLGLKLKMPSLPAPPLPPDIPFPNVAISGIPFPGFPALVLTDLLIGLIKLPFDLLKKLVLPPDISLAVNLHDLPKKVFGLALDIVIQLLTDLGILLVLPRIFVASLLIYLKNVVGMVCTDIIGLIVGAGTISKTAATLTGLV